MRVKHVGVGAQQKHRRSRAEPAKEARHHGVCTSPPAASAHHQPRLLARNRFRLRHLHSLPTSQVPGTRTPKPWLVGHHAQSLLVLVRIRHVAARRGHRCHTSFPCRLRSLLPAEHEPPTYSAGGIIKDVRDVLHALTPRTCLQPLLQLLLLQDYLSTQHLDSLNLLLQRRLLPKGQNTLPDHFIFITVVHICPFSDHPTTTHTHFHRLYTA